MSPATARGSSGHDACGFRLGSGIEDEHGPGSARTPGIDENALRLESTEGIRLIGHQGGEPLRRGLVLWAADGKEFHESSVQRFSDHGVRTRSR